MINRWICPSNPTQMMKVAIVLTALATFCFSLESHAQYEEDYLGDRDVMAIGAGAGFISFFGDFAKENDLANYTNIKAGYSVNLEHRFGSVFGAQIDGLYGTIAYNEVSRDVTKHRNFQSSLFSASAKAVFHLDNDIIIKRKSPFSPYLAFGIGYTKFNPMGDLKDKNGNTYHYWLDGTIRDIDENDVTAPAANILFRDYTYESELTDSITAYKRGALTFPLTFGIKLKMSPRIQGRIFATYNLTQTDFIDNVSENDNNDKFLYTGFTIHFVIRKKDPEAPNYDDVDFAELKSGDSDGDGIRDTDDNCQGTPDGVPVNEKGCPLDFDKDGVPDYLDKEEATEAGAIVDENGVTMTDEMLAAKYTDFKDSLTTERIETFHDEPSMGTLREIQSSIENGDHENDGTKDKLPIPASLKQADADANGFISADEISSAIDGFFEGTNDFTVKKLHDLIDFFFEQ